jgi:hypothetical protein
MPKRVGWIFLGVYCVAVALLVAVGLGYRVHGGGIAPISRRRWH